MLYRVSFSVKQPIVRAGEFIAYEEFAQRLCGINVRGVFHDYAQIAGMVCQMWDFEIPQASVDTFTAVCRSLRLIIRCERAVVVNDVLVDWQTEVSREHL